MPSRRKTTDPNIVQVRHLRAFTSVPLKAAQVEFVVQTRGLEAQEIVGA